MRTFLNTYALLLYNPVYTSTQSLTSTYDGTLNVNCETPDAGIRCGYDCNQEFAECAKNCANEYSCISDCNRDLVICQDDCPCYQNCFLGCPCEHESKWCSSDLNLLLVEPSREPNFLDQPPYQWETPVYQVQWIMSKDLLAIEVEAEPSIDDYFGVQWKMCSVVINNKFFLLGGENEFKQQQYRLDDCGFTKLEDLPFRFDGGRCAPIEMGTKAMMCAGIQEPRTCYVFDGNNNFQQSFETHWPHTTGDVVDANGKVFIIAGGSNLEVEQYSYHDRVWHHVGGMEEVMEPMENKRNESVVGYLEFGALAMNNTVFTFGGNLAYNRSGVDQLHILDHVWTMNITTYEWSLYEFPMLKPRVWMARIVSGANMVLIGGDNSVNTNLERWFYNGTGFEREVSENGTLPLTSHNWWLPYVIHEVTDYVDCLAISPKNEKDNSGFWSFWDF